MGILDWLSEPSTSGSSGLFNEAVRHWKMQQRAALAEDKQAQKQELLRVIACCQAAIDKNQNEGDAYVLLTNALIVASHLRRIAEEDSGLLRKYAVGAIHKWQGLPQKKYSITKNYDQAVEQGRRVLEMIQQAEGCSREAAESIMSECGALYGDFVISPTSYGQIEKAVLGSSNKSAPHNSVSLESKAEKAVVQVEATPVMPNFCPNCGKRTLENTSFCAECGDAVPRLKSKWDGQLPADVVMFERIYWQVFPQIKACMPSKLAQFVVPGAASVSPSRETIGKVMMIADTRSESKAKGKLWHVLLNDWGCICARMFDHQASETAYIAGPLGINPWLMFGVPMWSSASLSHAKFGARIDPSIADVVAELEKSQMEVFEGMGMRVNRQEGEVSIRLYQHGSWENDLDIAFKAAIWLNVNQEQALACIWKIGS